LNECKKVFHKYYHLEDDRLIDIAAGVYVANRLGADPLWLLILGPPSNTKTEILNCFIGHPKSIFISTITSNTIVSGFKRKNGSNPSLIFQFDGKLLVLKDFTSVLSMRNEPMMEIMGQLREIFDGKYDKVFGNGVEVHWKGKAGFLGACTNEYDDHHSVIQAMGERFLLYRTRNRDNGAMGLCAQEMVGREDQIRAEVREAFQKFIAQFDELESINFRDDQGIISAVISLACFVAIGRTPVKRDYRGEVKPVLFEPEGSGRLTKQLKQLGYGLAMVNGKDSIDDAVLTILRKVARDLIPTMRMKVIQHLWERRAYTAEGGWRSTSEIAQSLELPASTTKTVCEDLMIVGGMKRDLIEESSERGRPGYLWQLNDELTNWIACSGLFDS
jgi:hypothetical protein